MYCPVSREVIAAVRQPGGAIRSPARSVTCMSDPVIPAFPVFAHCVLHFVFGGNRATRKTAYFCVTKSQKLRLIPTKYPV